MGYLDQFLGQLNNLSTTLGFFSVAIVGLVSPFQ